MQRDTELRGKALTLPILNIFITEKATKFIMFRHQITYETSISSRMIPLIAVKEPFFLEYDFRDFLYCFLLKFKFMCQGLFA